MPIFTDGLRMAPEAGPDISDLGVSTSDMVDASAGEAFNELPTRRLLDIDELARAGGKPPPVDNVLQLGESMPPLAPIAGMVRGFKQAAEYLGGYDTNPAPTPDVAIADAKAQVRAAGLEKALTLPDQPTIRQGALDIMLDRARERRQRETTIARGPGGIAPTALSVGTSFLLGAVDPLNIASAFIPVVGELRYAKLLADAGESAIGRAGVRAGVGAASGAVGQAALEPIEAIAETQEGRDYTMAQALRSVLFGAALGGGLHAGFGAIGDALARRRGAEVPAERDGLANPDQPISEDVSTFAPSNEAAKSDIASPAGEFLRDRLGLSESTRAADRQAVHDDVAAQLTAAGMPADEAKANAAVVAARYATRAERMGEPSAFDLYKGEGLAITRPDNPGAIADEAGLTLEQAARSKGGAGESDLFSQREAEGQTSLPGTERIGQGELAQRRADQPLKPKVAQKDLDVGLFGDDAKQKSFFQRSPTAPTFYSAVSRAIDTAKQDKAPAAQWLGTLRNTPGVKPEELHWLGLEDWLKGQKGTVSKEAIADYVRANEIELHEVTKAAPSVENARAGYDLHPRYSSYQLPGGENYRELLLTLPERPVEINVTPPEPITELPEGYRIIHYGGNPPAREWGVIPPGQLHAGAMHGTEAASEAEAASKAIEQINYQRRASHDEQIRNARKNDTTNFKASHWDEPNVLAHVRFNDRVIDGKKTLFLEEIQSDWHQAGKRRGYTKAVEAAAADDLVDGKRVGVADNLEQVPFPHDGTDKWQFTNRRTGETEFGWGKTEAEAKASALEWVNGEMRRAAANTGVPDAPFKTTWPELALKRMIRFAAEHGYEKVAWTDGATQAERYDLSKHIQEVRWNEQTGDFQAKDHAGQVVVRRRATAEELPDIIGKEAAEKLLAQPAPTVKEVPKLDAADLNITQSEHQYTVRNSVDARHVDVGKGTVGSEAEALEYALRYLNKTAAEINESRRRHHDEGVGASRELSGLELKVGGEGMSGFYDKMLPAAANKLAKKFGAKVGQGNLEQVGGIGDWKYKGPLDLTPDQIRAAAKTSEYGSVQVETQLRQIADRVASGTPLDVAVETFGSHNAAKAVGGELVSNGKTVHTIDVTPALREAAVQEGFPLFQAGAEGTPQGRITLGENKAIVQLFAGADQSTFMHEMGHLWLDELARDAARAQVPQALKDDLGSVLRWLGVDKAEDIGTPQHEQWARGFEQYLAEGKAPSSALAAAFAKFKDWLKAIYRGLVGHQQPISDDVRAVMDRMLATDRELAQRPAPVMTAIADLPPQAHSDAMQASIAALIEDRPVAAGEMLQAAAQHDPRIAESMALAKPVAPARTGRGPKARDPETWSLLEFIAARGGIRSNDPLISDLRSIFGKSNRPVPGFGSVIREPREMSTAARRGGNYAPMTLDQAREAAVEAGYLQDEGHNTGREATTTVRDLLDAIDQETRGSKVYRYDRSPEPSKAELERRSEEETFHFESKVVDGLTEAGVDPSTLPDKTMARVVEIMRREGESDALAAYERAVMEETHYGADAGEHQRIDEHIPGWDDVPDDAGAAPAAGGAVAPGGERDAGGAARAAGDGDREAARDAGYRELADRSRGGDDPDAIAASRAADEVKAPPADPQGRLAAAEKAAADAEQLYKDAEAYLPEDLRDRITEQLEQHDLDIAARTEVIKRGGACLAAAVG